MIRRLLVLWDPDNPLVQGRAVVDALRRSRDVELTILTFEDVGHRTLPNRTFRLGDLPSRPQPDGILWIEGGPLPKDIATYSCPKVCWLPNSALEPTLQEALQLDFDHMFVGSLRGTSEGKAKWLPNSDGEKSPNPLPAGISVLVADPLPPAQVAFLEKLAEEGKDWGSPSFPLVFCLGNGGEVHPKVFDCLKAGAVVVADPESDVRGIAHVGEHLEVYPCLEGIGSFVKDLLADPGRLERLSTRGPAIYGHLHEPGLRAERLLDGLWPVRRVLSGDAIRPRVSILVTCYRYLKRLRLCLESLARQSLPSGSLEIVVADPESPDGLGAHLEEFARKYPEIRTVHLPLDRRYHRNRGVGINRAFEVSSGAVVVAIDGDLIFPPHLVGLLSERVQAMPNRIFGVRRSFVGKDETERILSEEIDPFSSFGRLSESPGDGEADPHVGILGYCQAVDREAFAKARYPEEFDMVNQSDIVFVERLKKYSGVTAEFLSEETVLHLWHPRNWAGTMDFL